MELLGNYAYGGLRMTPEKKTLLLYAGVLYELGIELDKARNDLALLVEQRVGYDTVMMRLAYEDYRQIASEFAALEKQYTALRNELRKK